MFEVWISLPACSVIVCTSPGSACPKVLVEMPATKSRYSLPSLSQTRVPLPRTSVMGSRRPTCMKSFASRAWISSLTAALLH